jgi:hypothetical protein
MKKGLILLITALLTVSCQYTAGTGSQSTVTVKATPTPSPAASAAATVADLALGDFPESASTDVSKDQESDLTSFVQKNSNKLFSFIPTDPESYRVNFTGDGSPVFLTGDGSPVFSVKSTGTDQDYLWSRKPGTVLIDYLQLTQRVQEGSEIRSYAKYSRLIEHEITVKGAVNTDKKVKLVKTLSFVMVQNGSSFRLESTTPVITRQVNPSTTPYQVRSLTFSSDKNKIIIYGDRKLFPMPGISLTKNIGTHKFKLYVEIVFLKDSKPDDMAVVVSLNDKQYQLQKTLGNVYGAEVEFPELKDPTGLIVELIDKKSLLQDEEYHGFTWVVPMTD